MNFQRSNVLSLAMTLHILADGLNESGNLKHWDVCAAKKSLNVPINAVAASSDHRYCLICVRLLVSCGELGFFCTAVIFSSGSEVTTVYGPRHSPILFSTFFRATLTLHLQFVQFYQLKEGNCDRAHVSPLFERDVGTCNV